MAQSALMHARWVSLSFLLLSSCSSGSFVVAQAASEDAATDSGTTTEDATTDDTAVASEASPGEASALDATAVVCTKQADCTTGYCKRAACGDATGACAPIPMPSPVFAPICGCDGITYWNEPHAGSFGVSRAHDGPCNLTERKACTSSCDLCVHEVATMVGCSAGTIPGYCMRAPGGAACAPSAGGPSVSTCGDKCKSMCEAIRDKDSFYVKTCTPG
ncbi:MAG: hypothetical protein ACXVEE_22995 [Polyangiales bacterium]